jgi:WD40 repeat protein
MLRTTRLLKAPTAPWLTTDNAISTIKNYINGQFIAPPSDDDAIHLYDPSTNRHLANIVSSHTTTAERWLLIKY